MRRRSLRCGGSGRRPSFRAPVPRPQGRQCVFCGKGPVTMEHLFPQWVTYLLKTSLHGFPSGNLIQIRTIGNQEYRWKTSTPLDFVAKTVCGECNNGWMSKIETDAIPYVTPMIEGEQITLDRPAQISVATWMGLRTFMSRSTQDVPMAPLLRDWFRGFYETQALPPR